MERTRDADRVLLILVFLACSVSTVVWTLLDETPPPWDPSDHLRWGYDYYANLAQLNLTGLLRDIFSVQHPYPPLVHLATAVVFLILGASRVTGVVVNLLMLGVMLASVRALGKAIYGSRAVAFGGVSISAGALAAMIAVSFHFSAWLLHDAFLDFPLAAMVAAAFLMLVRAGDFSDPRRAFAFGIVAGLGMLTKQTFAFFFLLPGLYVFVSVLRSRNKGPLLNLGVAVAALLAVAGLWYGPHFDDVLEIYRVNRLNANVENEPSVFTAPSLLFYWSALGAQMQIPLAIAFVAGTAWSFWRMRSRSVILYLWMASGVLAFTLIANKDVRYTVPVLPAAALLSVSWIGGSRSRQGRQRVAVAAIALAAGVTFANAQWPGNWSPFPGNYFGFDHRPLPQDWGVRRALAVIASESTARRPMVGVAVNLAYLNPSSVAAYARLMAPEGQFGPIVDVDWLTSDTAMGRLGDCDYVIARTDIEAARDASPLERRAATWATDNASMLAIVETFDLPPGYGRLNVYRRLVGQ